MPLPISFFLSPFSRVPLPDRLHTSRLISASGNVELAEGAGGYYDLRACLFYLHTPPATPARPPCPGFRNRTPPPEPQQMAGSTRSTT